ncbi:hypothetical protein FM110_10900 [Brachybacterium nesterenkovii]|uniref:Uncharacterized protein n=1 Tax=Brachybacterium nesterenkovii TaxID=47847 RepID=A0A1X6X502_9MICO|nr:hypothetical protein FM110_10900 [Brachybacterium nesterenkovii]
MRGRRTVGHVVIDGSALVVGCRRAVAPQRDRALPRDRVARPLVLVRVGILRRVVGTVAGVGAAHGDILPYGPARTARPVRGQRDHRSAGSRPTPSNPGPRAPGPRCGLRTPPRSRSPLGRPDSADQRRAPCNTRGTCRRDADSGRSRPTTELQDPGTTNGGAHRAVSAPVQKVRVEGSASEFVDQQT